MNKDVYKVTVRQMSDMFETMKAQIVTFRRWRWLW